MIQQAVRTPTTHRLRWFAVAALISNVLIVATGAAVRLTDSGLGCPTWPRCTDESLTPHGELTAHTAIEFGNRMLTFVLTAVAIAVLVATYRYRPIRRSLRTYAVVLAVGVPVQAVIGGVTVLTDLNPWIVSLHLLTSLTMIAVAVTFIRRIGETDDPPVATVSRSVVLLGRATALAGIVVLYLGTVVTGTGPHAGDENADRNGLDPETVSQLHANAVFVFVGLTLGCVLVMRSSGGPARAQRAAVALLTLQLAQGIVGFVQYHNDLPEILVELHVIGAAAITAALAWLQLGLRSRGSFPPD